VNEKTFGNYLKDAGYATCVVGKWQLNGVNTAFESAPEELMVRPQHFGFEEYCLWNFVENSGKRYADPRIFRNGELLEGLEDEYGPDVVCEYGMDFMERNRDKPFLLYYPMILVHAPFVPTPDSEEWNDSELRQKADDRFFKDMVEYTDKIVKRLIDKIEELGLSENTLFIFTSDNGTHYRLTTQTKDGPYKGGKGTMPDAGTHVPMVVYNPSKIKTPVEYNDLFEFNDFLPTFLELAGERIPEDLDGMSFYPLFTGSEQNPRKTLFMHYDPLRKGGNERWYGRFVRDKDYKLYSDGRFYNVSRDKLEQDPIPDNELTSAEKEIRESFQPELDKAPPHHFKQSDEY
jgi:arylsulfatase A